MEIEPLGVTRRQETVYFQAQLSRGESMRVGILALAALVSLSGNAAAQSGNAATQSLVERGNYLVNTVLTCGNCHTPKGPGGDVAEKAFSATSPPGPFGVWQLPQVSTVLTR